MVLPNAWNVRALDVPDATVTLSVLASVTPRVQVDVLYAGTVC